VRRFTSILQKSNRFGRKTKILRKKPNKLASFFGKKPSIINRSTTKNCKAEKGMSGLAGMEKIFASY